MDTVCMPVADVRMIGTMKLIAFVLLIVATASPVLAQTLQARIEAALSAASPGTRFGLVVVDAFGKEIVVINPDGRFIPASNTKIVTTAAAYMALAALDQPDTDGGARVRIERDQRRKRHVVLEGRGDARLSSAPDCVINCLAALADAVAAATRKVYDVIGDDTRFADQRWSPGMSWNNIPTRSGTATSALSIDDNEIMMTVTPTLVGAPPMITVPSYYSVENRAVTGAAGSASTLDFTRAPGGFVVHLSGQIPADALSDQLLLGVDDPAHHAAWVLREMLLARNVKVKGRIIAHHRPVDVPPAAPLQTTALATLTPPPLAEDIMVINKVSQNLHAELLLRRLGGEAGSIEGGMRVVRTMFERAGVDPRHYHFADGSGMSTYNRIAPRAMVKLLRWIARQPWGSAWRTTLPVGGEGMLARRYARTALAGRLSAKTGTINATSALSGYMTGTSGQPLIFATFANDIPDGDNAARAVDAALIEIASEN